MFDKEKIKKLADKHCPKELTLEKLTCMITFAMSDKNEYKQTYHQNEEGSKET